MSKSLSEARVRAERRAILEALRQSGGNRESAAALLRISKATLYRKLRSLAKGSPPKRV